MRDKTFNSSHRVYRAPQQNHVFTPLPSSIGLPLEDQHREYDELNKRI